MKLPRVGGRGITWDVHIDFANINCVAYFSKGRDRFRERNGLCTGDVLRFYLHCTHIWSVRILQRLHCSSSSVPRPISTSGIDLNQEQVARSPPISTHGIDLDQEPTAPPPKSTLVIDLDQEPDAPISIPGIDLDQKLATPPSISTHGIDPDQEPEYSAHRPASTAPTYWQPSPTSIESLSEQEVSIPKQPSTEERAQMHIKSVFHVIVNPNHLQKPYILEVPGGFSFQMPNGNCVINMRSKMGKTWNAKWFYSNNRGSSIIEGCICCSTVNCFNVGDLVVELLDVPTPTIQLHIYKPGCGKPFVLNSSQ